uniref:hypothetical protein n=1 Tax=Streptomyces sp. F11 TaxID=319318 RepID=UPI001867FE6C|nr:hypothetical protein [Streptomyces sp. F11]
MTGTDIGDAQELLQRYYRDARLISSFQPDFLQKVLACSQSDGREEGGNDGGR